MSVMAIEKKQLSFEDIEAQTALELPERETPDTVIVTCLAVCVGKIQFRDINATVAAQVCAAVAALNVSLLSILGVADVLDCDIRVRQGG